MATGSRKINPPQITDSVDGILTYSLGHAMTLVDHSTCTWEDWSGCLGDRYLECKLNRYSLLCIRFYSDGEFYLLTRIQRTSFLSIERRHHRPVFLLSRWSFHSQTIIYHFKFLNLDKSIRILRRTIESSIRDDRPYNFCPEAVITSIVLWLRWFPQNYKSPALCFLLTFQTWLTLAHLGCEE
jgi:hypothetical protein